MRALEPVPDRAALLSLAVAGTVAVAPYALELPIWLVLLFLAFALWRYAIERWSLYHPGRTLRYALTGLAVALTFQQYHTLLGRDAGLMLLIALLGVKFLELKRYRDYRVSAFLFYLVILGAFLYEQSLALGLYALVAVLANTAALVHFAAPDELNPGARLRLASGLIFRALPLMLLLYFLFPRLHGALWALPDDSSQALTGLDDTMQLGDINHLAESSDLAMRVTFEGEIPARRDRYFRALVLWETDGRSWRRGPALGDAAEMVPRGPPWRYEVVLEPSNRRWLPALDLPFGPPPQARVRAGFTLEHREAVRERLRYALTSFMRYTTGELTERERAAALQLPDTISPRARALAKEWATEHGDAREIANAALTLFRREAFVYTLTPPPLGADPVDEFLFGTRRGFCEHYAAAFVTLMRAANVPARVVTGYQGGEVNEAGGYLMLRQQDAHAWAEVWVAGTGWTRFDPTAAIAPERVELGSDAVRRMAAAGRPLGVGPIADSLQGIEIGIFERGWLTTRLYWDLANLSWYRWVTDFGPERQRELLAALGLERVSLRGLLLLMMTAVLAVALLYALWLARNRERLDPAQRAYARFCRKLARAGVARAPAEGPVALAERAMAHLPDRRAAIDAITKSYVAARYGSGGRIALSPLRRAVRAFR